MPDYTVILAKLLLRNSSVCGNFLAERLKCEQIKLVLNPTKSSSCFSLEPGLLIMSDATLETANGLHIESHRVKISWFVVG